MVEVKNQFANHLLFWGFALPLVSVLVLPAMLPADDFVIAKAELSFFNDVLGKDTAAITASCDALFDKLFIKSGIAPAVRDFLAPSQSALPGGTKLASFSSNASRSYNDALWLMVYRGLWRLTGLWPTLLAGLLAFGLPSLVDGLAVRARKAYNFQFHNPVFFWSASHSLIFVIGFAFLIPFLPYALSPVLLTGFSVTFAAALWITAANFQTGN